MKKILSFVLALFMVFTSTMAISADDNPKVEFTGVQNGETYRIGDTVKFGIKTTGNYNDGGYVVGVGEVTPNDTSTVVYGDDPFNESEFGPFPFINDKISEFDITFAQCGTFTWTIKILDYSSKEEVCNTSVTLTICADAAIENVVYPTLNKAIEAVEDGDTITILRDVDDATGISIPSGKKFTVDFDNHTYSLHKPGAGSANTKTSGFQILKNSVISFKNGTINCTEENKDFTWVKTDSEKGIAMIIQNYADLTLDNMTIDGTNVARNGASVRYVMSNNSGNVIYNDSKIITAENDFAFDSCKYDTYEEPTVVLNGTEVNGKVEASGGDITFAEDSVLNGQLRVGENKSGGATGSMVTISNGATINHPTFYPIVVFGANTLIIEGEVNGCVATNGNAYNAGSIITVKDGASINNTASGQEGGTAIYLPNGTLNINGGTITGTTAVYFKSTELYITGGTLIGNGDNVAYDYYGNGCYPTGDALVVDNCDYPSGLLNISITGGYFKSTNAKTIGSYYGNGKTESLKGFVTGGYFEKDIDEELIANGHKKSISDVSGYSKMVEEVNGSVVVKEKQPDVTNEVQGTDGTTIGEALDAKKPVVEDLVDSVKTASIATIITEAKKELSALNSATDIKVEIKAKVEAVEATLSSASKNEDKTLTFKVTPFAIVSDVGDSEISKEVAINNSYLSPNAKIKVTLPTCGITPKEVIHIRDNGSKEYFFLEGDKRFVDNGDGTVTVEISNFSKIQINAKVTYVAPKQNDHGKKKTYKAPSTGIY